MSAPSVDPELEAVAWDLDPLLDGGADDPDAAVTAMLAEAQAPRGGVRASATPARSPSSTAPGWSPRCTSSRRSRSSSAAPAPTRCCSFSGDTADPPRGALLQKVQEGATEIETTLLFFELEWAALDDDARRRAARRRRARLRPPPPAHRAPLPAAPALRARGEDPRREGAHRPQRVDAAVRGAGRRRSRSSSRASRARLARGRAVAAVRRPTATSAATPPRRVTAALAARPAHARLHLQHAARRQGGRRPAARLPALAGQPQPRQRGVRRVGRGAGRGRPRRATSSRAAGTG